MLSRSKHGGQAFTRVLRQAEDDIPPLRIFFVRANLLKGTLQKRGLLQQAY